VTDIVIHILSSVTHTDFKLTQEKRGAGNIIELHLTSVRMLEQAYILEYVREPKLSTILHWPASIKNQANYICQLLY
jgi:hypothetical protein